MSEKLIILPGSSSTSLPEGAADLGASTGDGVDQNLIGKINDIRVKPQYAHKSESVRAEPTDPLPGQKVGDWIFEGRSIVKGKGAGGVVYGRPTEVITVSKPIRDGTSLRERIPAGYFEAWRAAQEEAALGAEISKTEAEKIGETAIEPFVEASKTVLQEAEPKVASFKTARGSIYTYDSDGKTTRFKTAASSESERQQEKQDITVFADLSPEEERTILDAIHSENPDLKAKVYVLERQPDDKPRIIRDITEVKLPDSLYIGVFKNDKFVSAIPATLEPQVGSNVFDTRHFVENGEEQTERHLGNKVAEITRYAW